MREVIRDIHALWKIFSRISATNGETFEKPKLVTIEDYRPPKTSAQNAKMHILWREVAHHTGRSEDEIKSIFKMEWGPRDEVSIENGRWDIPKSTRKYSRKECAEMMDITYMKGAEWGVEFND